MQGWDQAAGLWYSPAAAWAAALQASCTPPPARGRKRDSPQAALHAGPATAPKPTARPAGTLTGHGSAEVQCRLDNIPMVVQPACSLLGLLAAGAMGILGCQEVQKALLRFLRLSLTVILQDFIGMHIKD